MFNGIKKELNAGKNLITFIGLQVTSQVIDALIPFFVAKLFLPELFASYELSRTLIFLVAAITISSAQNSFIIYANEERTQRGKINRTFSVQCVFAGGSLGVFYCITLFLSKPLTIFTKISEIELFFVSLAFVGFVLKTFLANLFLGLGERNKCALTGLVYNILTVATIVLFYLLGHLNLSTIFLTYFLSSVLIILIFLKTIPWKSLFPFEFEVKYFKGMLLFTTWMMIGVTAGHFINWGDKYFLRAFVTMEEIGICSLSYLAFKGLTYATSSLNSYFIPFISQHLDNKEKLRTYLYSKRPRILALGLAGLVGIFFLFPYILRYIFGDTYLGAEAILKILLIANGINLYITFYAPFFNVLKKYRDFNIICIIHALINLILFIILIPRIGIKGAAIATVIAFFCRAIIVEIYFRYNVRSILKI